MHNYRGHDDAIERAGADATLLAYLAQRPDIVQKAAERDEPAARHLVERLGCLRGLLSQKEPSDVQPE